MPEPTHVEDLLIAAANDPENIAARNAFTDALLESNVFVLGHDAEDTFSPLPLVREDGTATVGFFSSIARVEHAWPEIDQPGLTIREIGCREFWQMVVAGGAAAVLNPFNVIGKEFVADEMGLLLSGGHLGDATRVMPAGTQYRIAEIAETPTQLVSELRKAFDQIGGVQWAQLAWITFPEGNSGYFLVVRTDGPQQPILDVVQPLVELADEHSIDVTFEGADGPALAPGIKPFYGWL